MQQLRWGILSTGFISEVMAAAIIETPNNHLQAIGSRHLDRAQSFAAKFDVPHAAGDLSAVLQDKDVDVVYIALPNHLHAEWVIKAAQAGKHILCEKPFTVTAQEAEQVFEVVKQAGVFCMEAQMYRCHPQTAKLVELIQQNVIGEVFAINASFSDDIHAVANPTAGGSMMELGCYLLSIVRLIAAASNDQQLINPISIKASGCIDESNNTDKYASAILDFSSGCVATISTSNRYGLESHLNIIGSKGSMQVLNPWLPECEHNKIIVTLAGESPATVIEVSSDLSLYATEVDIVYKNIMASKQQATFPAMSWQDTSMNMALLDQWRSQVGLIKPSCQTSVVR